MKKRANRRSATNDWSQRPRAPKLCGADIELGNFILGLSRQSGTDFDASRALLREIKGSPRAQLYHTVMCECADCQARRLSQHHGSISSRDDHNNGRSHGTANSYSAASGYGVAGDHGYDPQDWGRKFLASNGGCVYIDLNHLELCLPEVLSAWDHVACWHAMLRIARQALEAANAKLPEGQKIQVLVNNSDGNGNSYGSHLDFLITRRAWDNIFHRKIHHLLYLAAYQASSIVFTGQGKVGSENGAPPVAFQLSQRADFFETLIGAQTTCNRPLVNSRDEPLCGRRRYGDLGSREAGADLARLHVIFFDNTLAQVASLLKVGVMQILLAMLEAERINPYLILDDPVEAVILWSHDPTLQAHARLVSGKQLTAVELQLLLLEEAQRFVASGGCDGIVPAADEVLALWADTLLKLQAGDLAALAPRLDWVLKLCILQRAMKQRPGLDWDAPQIKHLDHVYSSLDRSEGLYWAYEDSGFVERVVTEAQIEHFRRHPPENTRAWTRAMLLRCADPDVIADVDWDFIRFKIKGQGYWPKYRTLDLANPTAFTRAASEPSFKGAATFEALLDALGAPQEDRYAGAMHQWQGYQGYWI